MVVASMVVWALPVPLVVRWGRPGQKERRGLGEVWGVDVLITATSGAAQNNAALP